MTHQLAVVDDSDVGRRFTRASVLNNAVAKVKATPAVHRKWCTIAQYESANTASCTAWSLRKRFPVEDGWEFRSKKREGRSHVLVCYSPEDR